MDQSTGISPDLQQERLERVLNKRRNRTSRHIHQFFRLTIVIINNPISINQDDTFEITVDRTQTVEYLTRQIEADWLFRKNSMNGSPEDDGPTQQRLEISMLHDAGNMALKFSETIENVLGPSDVVFALNTFEVSPSTDFDLLSFSERKHSTTDLDDSSTRGTFPASSTITSLHSLLSNDASSAHVMHPTSLQSSRGRPMSMLKNPTMDERLQAILHNKLALRYFSEFCIEEYTIENLLFYVDVELFQSYDNEMRALFAKYIYHMYISDAAPLQVNISAEVKKDIPCPLQLQQSGVLPELSMFDEAQQQVYSMLKGHSYVRFERSPKYAAYQDAKRIDRVAYTEARIRGSYADYFRPDIVFASSIAKMYEQHAAGQPPNLEAQNISTSPPGSAPFKEAVLYKAMDNYFPQATQIIPGYFSVNQRVQWCQKQRKMAKEKKLAKFFGERPTRELIVRQTQHLPQSRSFNDGQSLFERRESVADSEAGDTPVPSTVPGVEIIVDTHENATRRKKMEKLEGFFGDRLPNKELREQRLVHQDEFGGAENEAEGEELDESWDRAGSKEEALAPAGATVNELDSAQRKILTKRNKKIQSMFGEHLDESMVQRSLKEPMLPNSNLGVSNDRLRESTGSRAVSIVETESLLSLYTGDEDPEAAANTARKKKMDKISQFLGERISVNQLQEFSSTSVTLAKMTPTPMNAEERALAKRRLNKLEKLLGAVPPPTASTPVKRLAPPTSGDPSLSPRNSESNVSAKRNSMTSLGSNVAKTIRRLSDLLQRGDVVELLERLTVIDEESEIVTPIVVEPGSNTKESRQKRLNKLRKFFGDNIDIELLVEQQVLQPLNELMLSPENSPEEVQQMQKDISAIRAMVQRQSEELTRDTSTERNSGKR
ncbi:hypothetical protein BJ742DRAFT_849898 [Cladochytrium replicatum]|nr:hypothetical protein BJ742DRAFT_849898 [Cladochytrium replicatum]